MMEKIDIAALTDRLRELQGEAPLTEESKATKAKRDEAWCNSYSLTPQIDGDGDVSVLLEVWGVGGGLRGCVELSPLGVKELAEQVSVLVEHLKPAIEAQEREDEREWAEVEFPDKPPEGSA